MWELWVITFAFAYLYGNYESRTTCEMHNVDINIYRWSKMQPPQLTSVYLVNNKRQLSYIGQYIPISIKFTISVEINSDKMWKIGFKFVVITIFLEIYTTVNRNTISRETNRNIIPAFKTHANRVTICISWK